MAAQCYVDFQTWRAAVTQHLSDARDRLSAPRRVFDYFGHHELAIFGIARALVRNQYFVRNTLAVRHHHAEALLVIIAAHDLRESALQHFNNRALFTPPVVHT